MHKKCPFSIPSVPGVDGKRRRQEEERRKREMSIQEPFSSPKKDKDNNYQSRSQSNAKILTSSLMDSSIYDEKFCFQLDQPISGDSSVYWQYDLSNQVTGEYGRTLIFREQQYFVRSEIGTPAQTIYISVPGLYGLKNQQGQFTNRVCALHLSSMSSLIDDSNRKVYDLLYKQLHDVAVDIPMNIATLRFKVLEDETQRTGTLGAPLICQFDIRHSGK